MWSDRAYRELLRPCQGGWPHYFSIEALKYEDTISIRCVNCEREAGRLSGEQARRVIEQNQRRIDERDRSTVAGQPQSADVDECPHPLVAEAPASGGAPMASNEERA